MTLVVFSLSGRMLLELNIWLNHSVRLWLTNGNALGDDGPLHLEYVACLWHVFQIEEQLGCHEDGPNLKHNIHQNCEHRLEAHAEIIPAQSV